MAKEVKESKKEWTVIESFYDELQKRVVEVGETVAHSKRREELKLIELK